MAGRREYPAPYRPGTGPDSSRTSAGSELKQMSVRRVSSLPQATGGMARCHVCSHSVRKKAYFFGWGVFSGDRIIENAFFRHGVEDDYLRSKRHVEGELAPWSSNVLMRARKLAPSELIRRLVYTFENRKDQSTNSIVRTLNMSSLRFIFRLRKKRTYDLYTFVPSYV